MKYHRWFRAWLVVPLSFASVAAKADLAFFSDNQSKTVEAFELGTYDYFGSLGFGDLVDPRGVAQSSSSVYVSDSDMLYRYDQATFLPVAKGSGGLSDFGKISFDGKSLFAITGGGTGVGRFDADTLDYLDGLKGIKNAGALLATSTSLFVGVDDGVQVYDSATGNLLSTITDGHVDHAIGLARNAFGDLFVLSQDGEVDSYDANGVYRTSFGLGFAPDVRDIGVSPDGEIWVLDALQEGIVQFDPDGNYLGFFGNGNGFVPIFNGPTALALPPVTAVPEPTTLVALTFGFAALARRRRK